MKKLQERTAVVRCRQADAGAVKDVLEGARKQYTAVYGEEAPTLTLDQRDYLPPAPKGDADDGENEGLSW